MSQENVEVVCRAWKAFADRGLDGLGEFFDSNLDYRAAEGAPDDVGEMHGLAAFRRYAQESIDMFDDITIVTEKLIDAGGDIVVSVLRAAGRAKISGIETELRYAVVYTVRDGKIVRGREYLTLEQALEAVRLSE
jgi:ketosteroid isomerase-like protein